MRKLKVEELNRLSVDDFKSTEKREIVVILDNIRSMHNVGSVFRSADAFLLKKVYLCGYTPQPPHREIRKTAIGAEQTVDWEAVEDVVSLVTTLKSEGYQILALEQAEGSTQLPSFSRNPDAKYALVIGHEIDGVQQAIIDLADNCLEIPQFGTKHSLNVSVAAGIALYKLTF